MIRSRRAPVLAMLSVATLHGVAAAQTVLLQMHPHVGDTLRVRMEQRSELIGISRSPRGDVRTSVTTMLEVWSHAIVEGSTPDGAVVRTVTDSALVSGADPAGGARRKPTRVPVHAEVRMRVMPNGTMQLASDESDRHGDADLAGLMPAAFPSAAVRLGESWTREMSLPSVLGGAPAGVLRAEFRFDSLGRGGALAYVSMRGAIAPATADADGSVAGPALDGGTVTGTLVLDRKRGWLAESRFAIDATTTVTPPATVADGPLHFRMRVTQRVKTLDRR